VLPIPAIQPSLQVQLDVAGMAIPFQVVGLTLTAEQEVMGGAEVSAVNEVEADAADSAEMEAFEASIPLNAAASADAAAE
jgi:hypothetical protein